MRELGQILQQSKLMLRDCGVPSYSLDSFLLLNSALNLSREYIICNPDYIVSDNDFEKYNTLLQRRLKREPISHILGVREFWGRDFKVTSDTLDPRPDSETLIESVLDIYKNSDKELKIIDFGTGTGCLLLTILLEFPNAIGVGVDISKAALEVAKDNVIKLGLAKRTSFVVSNWGKEIKGKFDLIISNPPYIKRSDIKRLDPEVSVYEPKLALDGGSNGLDCYNELAPFVASGLFDDGFLVLEHGMSQEDDIRVIFESYGLQFVANRKDLLGINRCIIFRKIS